MLSPKRVKHRKQMRQIRTRLFREATRGNNIAFGEYGIVALTHNYVTSRQIEATRIALSRKMKRGGKVWIRIFPDYPYTRKPAETRMGSGKGNLDQWVACVKRGQILFEIAGVLEETAVIAIRSAMGKLPLKAKLAKRG